MEKTKTGIILLLVVLVLILLPLQKCFNDSKPVICPDDESIIIVRDTVWPKDTPYKIIDHYLPRITDSVYVPTYIPITPQDSDSICKIVLELMNHIKIYEDSLEDENLKIYFKDSLRGVLIHKIITYKLKIPKEINTTITSYNIPKFSLYGGMFISEQQKQLDFGPSLGIRYKNINLHYSKSFLTKEDYLSLGFNIKFKKRAKKAYF